MDNNVASAANPKINGLAPHLMCCKEDVCPIVLLPGDPARVHMFKELVADFEIIAENREYTLGKGTYRGIPFNVCSTGIGGGSTEIAVIELIELGAKVLIRIGGTGVLRSDIRLGEMVINTAALRKGGSSNFYAPDAYPAVASYRVVDALVTACEARGVIHHEGISASVGSFFAGQGRPVLGKDFHSKELLEEYERLNILNMEMEAETIMTLGSIFGVDTGSICAVHANRADDEWLVDFESKQKQMCQIALDSCEILGKKYFERI